MEMKGLEDKPQNGPKSANRWHTQRSVALWVTNGHAYHHQLAHEKGQRPCMHSTRVHLYQAELVSSLAHQRAQTYMRFLPDDLCITQRSRIMYLHFLHAIYSYPEI